MLLRFLAIGCCVTYLMLSSVMAVQAREASPAAGTQVEPMLESFIDGHVKSLMDKGGVPGVTVSVVRDGEIALVKSYGVRNRETGLRVDPETTLFRIGSVTKLMTTMVILGLIDEGVLDLDSDINTYLKTIKIPDTFEEPVTLRHILTHMGGFKDTSSYLHRSSDNRTGMSSQEMQRMIGRVRPSGQLRAYDNTAFGILGIVIADVTGKPFRKAVAERIFKPLGMKNSVIGLPAAWEERASRGHGISLHDPAGRPEVKQAHLARLVEAAGAASSTAADMAKFMKMLMNGGTYDGGRLLAPGTFQTMMDFEAHRAHPMVPSLGFTIYESDYEGRRAIGHGGLIDGFATELAIFPDARLGIFISSNVGPQSPPLNLNLILEELQVSPAVIESAGNAMAVSRSTVLELAKAYVPITEGWGKNNKPEKAHGSEPELFSGAIAGRYVTGGVDAGVTLATRLFLGGLGGQEFAAAGNGLSLGGQELNRLASGYYGTADGNRTYAFKRIGKDIFQVSHPLGWGKKVSAFTGPLYTILPLVAGLALLLSALVYWFPLGQKSWRRVGQTMSVAAVLFVVAFLIELQFAEYILYVSNATAWMVLWRLAMNLSLLAMLVAFFMALRLFIRSPGPASIGSWIRAVHMVLLMLGCLAVIVTSAYWGILGVVT